MRLNPRFYSHPSWELMRLKKGLIKIWGNLAKKQNKTKHKTSAKKEKKPSMYTKEVSINDGSGDHGANAKCTFLSANVPKSLVGQGLSCRAWQWEWQASEFSAGRWGKFKGNFLL